MDAALGREAEQLNRAAEAAPETARRTQAPDRTASLLESMRAFDPSRAASAARLELRFAFPARLWFLIRRHLSASEVSVGLGPG